MKWNDKDLAFVHFGKAGGQYVSKYILRNFGKGHVALNSFTAGLNRDWSKAELEVIASKVFHKENNYFVTNHHLNFGPRLIQIFNDFGWGTFCFVRDPRDVIVSLYFYGKKLIKQGKDCAGSPCHPAGVLAGHLPKDSYLPPDVMKISLNEFCHQMIKRPELNRFWFIPEWLSGVDFIAPINDSNLSRFFGEKFDHEYKPSKRVNVSGSKGYAAYCKNGEISKEVSEEINGNARIQTCLNRIKSWT